MLNNKGQSAVGLFVAVAILIAVGAIVFAEFDTTASGLSATTAGTAAIANVTSNAYSGFNIVSIAPIIVAAVVVLGLVTLLQR